MNVRSIHAAFEIWLWNKLPELFFGQFLYRGYTVPFRNTRCRHCAQYCTCVLLHRPIRHNKLKGRLTGRMVMQLLFGSASGSCGGSTYLRAGDQASVNTGLMPKGQGREALIRRGHNTPWADSIPWCKLLLASSMVPPMSIPFICLQRPRAAKFGSA